MSNPLSYSKKDTDWYDFSNVRILKFDDCGGFYSFADGSIQLSNHCLNRTDMGLLGTLGHEIMHKVIHNFIGARECDEYDNIFWSMRIDHDYHDIFGFNMGDLD